MKSVGYSILLSVSLFILNGCEVSKQNESYEFNGSSPLTLTVINHPHGYEKSSCFNCHMPQNIHQVDNLKDPSFQFAKDLVEQKGLESCVGCHGSNGVQP